MSAPIVQLLPPPPKVSKNRQASSSFALPISNHHFACIFRL
jgi:hypothetical protein